jgi:hypothetical protein
LEIGTLNTKTNATPGATQTKTTTPPGATLPEPDIDRDALARLLKLLPESLRADGLQVAWLARLDALVALS